MVKAPILFVLSASLSVQCMTGCHDATPVKHESQKWVQQTPPNVGEAGCPQGFECVKIPDNTVASCAHFIRTRTTQVPLTPYCQGVAISLSRQYLIEHPNWEK